MRPPTNLLSISLLTSHACIATAHRLDFPSLAVFPLKAKGNKGPCDGTGHWAGQPTAKSGVSLTRTMQRRIHPLFHYFQTFYQMFLTQ